MFAVVLYQPEIPGNTGNIIRLCANTGSELHLVAPLGFRWDDRDLKRAGLDYHEYANVVRHADWPTCRATLAGRRLYALTTKGARCFDTPVFSGDEAFLFGPESRGLPAALLDEFDAEHRLRLPMRPGQRSLNLSNAAAVTVFAAWRQIGYAGGE